MILARGIGHPHGVPIDRLQHSDAREIDRVAFLGGVRQKAKRRPDLWQVAFRFRNNVGKMGNSIAQRRQPGAIAQNDRFSKTS
jgi:hypothetical protein